MASPYHPDGTVEGVPRWRLVLSRSCSALYGLIAPVRLYTYTSVFRAYRREVIDTVSFQEDGFVSASEILIRAAEVGLSDCGSSHDLAFTKDRSDEDEDSANDSWAPSPDRDDNRTKNADGLSIALFQPVIAHKQISRRDSPTRLVILQIIINKEIQPW